MHLDELYKYIGYGLVSLLLFYIVTRSIQFQLGIVEGLVGIKKETKKAEAAPTAEAQPAQAEAQPAQAEAQPAQAE